MIATIGFFDGVHRGHRYLLEQLKAEATSAGEPSLVVTFSNHPLNVIRSGYRHPLLSSPEEKVCLLHKAGVDRVELLDFDARMMMMDSFHFMRDVMVERFGVSRLLIGYDNRIGHDRESTFDDYVRMGREIGLDVCLARERVLDGSKVSSSAIRDALLSGDISTANMLLGYDYSLSGKVVGGFRNGRMLGFPTANIQPLFADKLIPADGAYAVDVAVDGATYRGMLNIGYRPTYSNGKDKSIEVHIIDFSGDIYAESISVSFRRFLRSERKFDSIDQLRMQLLADREEARKG